GSATWRRGVSALLHRGLARDPAEKAKSGLGTLDEHTGTATSRRGETGLLHRGLARGPAEKAQSGLSSTGRGRCATGRS
ncbi:MAG: hypothetical protein ACK6DU_08785, partial [Planctomycetota bacterium]